MEKQIDYRVIQAANLEDLVKTVQDHLEQGQWRCQGGMTITNTLPTPTKTSRQWYTQTMVKIVNGDN